MKANVILAASVTALINASSLRAEPKGSGPAYWFVEGNVLGGVMNGAYSARGDFSTQLANGERVARFDRAPERRGLAYGAKLKVGARHLGGRVAPRVTLLLLRGDSNQLEQQGAFADYSVSTTPQWLATSLGTEIRWTRLALGVDAGVGGRTLNFDDARWTSPFEASLLLHMDLSWTMSQSWPLRLGACAMVLGNGPVDPLNGSAATVQLGFLWDAAESGS